MLRLVQERDSLRVVADQHGCPTAAGDLAETILQIVRRISAEGEIPWGTYHYCGAGSTTWHGFAEAIVQLAAPVLRRSVPVIPITTADYPTPARRPANSILDCRRIRERLAIEPRPWRVSLKEVMDELIGCRAERFGVRMTAMSRPEEVTDLPSVRLSAREILDICRVLSAELAEYAQATVWLFGSRTNMQAKGGDIDLFIEVEGEVADELALMRRLGPRS